MTLGEIVYEYRTSHKYSLRDFGKICDLSYVQISLIEKGVNSRGLPFKPGLETLEKLAKGMGTSVDVLLKAMKGQDVSITGGDLNGEDISPEKQALIDRVLQMDPAQLDRLSRLLDIVEGK